MNLFARSRYTAPVDLWQDAAKDETAFENRMAMDDTRNERRELQAIADEAEATLSAMLGPALSNPLASKGFARMFANYRELLTSEQTPPPEMVTDFLVWCAGGMVDERELETLVA